MNSNSIHDCINLIHLTCSPQICGTQRQTLSRSYGRCIAEFLNEGSPEHLGLLDPTTCFGLRYGRRNLLTHYFSCQFGLRESQHCCRFYSHFTADKSATTYLNGHNQKSAHATILRHNGEQLHRYRNINLLSIAYATRLGLGPTNPGTINVAQETLVLRRVGFSPTL